MFIAALLTIAKKWNHPECPAIDEQIMKMYTYTQWSFTQLYRKKYEIYKKIKGTGKYY